MSTTLQQLTAAQANKEVAVNRNFETTSWSGCYGKKQSTSSGLTWGYYGGRWGGFSIADGTHTLTNAADNYIVVLKSTGVPSVSTATTNWNNTTDYARVYKVTTAGSVVTATEDHRAGPSGVHGGGGVGTVDASNVTYTPTTLADWESSSDPGNADDAFDELASRVKVLEGAGAGAYADAYDVRDFGALNNDGTTDDSATFILAAASGARVIHAENLNCAITSVVDIPDGQVWVMSGSTFTTTVTNAAMFRANLVDDWALVGPFTIVGPGSTSGTAKGVHVIGCNRWRISDLTARTVRGWGIYVEDGAESGTLRGDQGHVRNFRGESCYIGYQDTVGSAAEYSTLESPFITGCGTGLMTAAGNVQVIGGHIVDNTGDGVVVGNGSNHAHGQFIGVNINHNGGYDLRCTLVQNGQDFIGCHFYEGGIFLDGCKGVIIRDGHFDGDIVNDSDTGSGQNYLLDMYCPGAYGTGGGGVVAVSGDATSALTLAGLMGAGVPLSSGEFECFTVAASDETTALTTGAAKITFRMPFAMTLFAGAAGIRAQVNTAPTGATLNVDVNVTGTGSILSTALTIDASEKTSTTAATPVVISTRAIADDAEVTIDIDQIGSTIAGAGLKVTFRGTRPKAA